MIFIGRIDFLILRVTIVQRKIATPVRTMAPAGAILAKYEMTIPDTIDAIAIPIEMIAVFLNPLPNSIAVIFGRTISADIKRTPTSLMDVTTVIAASTIKM